MNRPKTKNVFSKDAFLKSNLSKVFQVMLTPKRKQPMKLRHVTLVETRETW